MHAQKFIGDKTEHETTAENNTALKTWVSQKRGCAYQMRRSGEVWIRDCVRTLVYSVEEFTERRLGML